MQTPNEEEQVKGTFQAHHGIYYVFGFIELLFLIRIGLKLIGANPVSGFVNFIYSLTIVLIAPFNQLFQNASAPIFDTTSVLEPLILVGMFVYAVAGWGIAQLLKVPIAENG